jgi:hypothetical protein
VCVWGGARRTALRHLHVLAVQARCVATRDLETEQLCRVRVRIALHPTADDPDGPLGPWRALCQSKLVRR